MADDLTDLNPEQIVLDQARWDAFVALVEAPPKPAPRLRELLRRPIIFDKGE